MLNRIGDCRSWPKRQSASGCRLVAIALVSSATADQEKQSSARATPGACSCPIPAARLPAGWLLLWCSQAPDSWLAPGNPGLGREALAGVERVFRARNSGPLFPTARSASWPAQVSRSPPVRNGRLAGVPRVRASGSSAAFGGFESDGSRGVDVFGTGWLPRRGARSRSVLHRPV
jgi:hypothetical protein